MLAIERRNEILSAILRDGKVVVGDLSQRYCVTEETIRRDLEKLENDGMARRTYGGAVRVEDFKLDLPYNVRKQANVEGKQYIGSKVAEMVSDGDYIIVDASTTTLQVLRSIMNKKRITLITNSVEALLELVNKTDWNVMSTGGQLKEGGLSLVGYQAEKMVESFHVDLAIISCKGVDEATGFTDSNEKDAEIKKAFLRVAKKRVMAVDGSKFGKISFVRIGDLNDVDVIVTDSDPGTLWQQNCEVANVKLVF